MQPPFLPSGMFASLLFRAPPLHYGLSSTAIIHLATIKCTLANSIAIIHQVQLRLTDLIATDTSWVKVTVKNAMQHSKLTWLANILGVRIRCCVANELTTFSTTYSSYNVQY